MGPRTQDVSKGHQSSHPDNSLFWFPKWTSSVIKSNLAQFRKKIKQGSGLVTRNGVILLKNNYKDDGRHRQSEMTRVICLAEHVVVLLVTPDYSHQHSLSSHQELDRSNEGHSLITAHLGSPHSDLWPLPPYSHSAFFSCPHFSSCTNLKRFEVRLSQKDWRWVRVWKLLALTWKEQTIPDLILMLFFHLWAATADLQWHVLFERASSLCKSNALLMKS